MRKTRVIYGGGAEKAQDKIDVWISEGDVDETLDLSNLNLTSLPTLPNNLKKLNCIRNKLSSLPRLPNSLKKIYCNENELTSLPDLPNSLEVLLCHYNKLKSLPSLPNSLKGLFCYNNELKRLPTLPKGLEYLYCNSNKLISLPILPNSLVSFNCNNNNLPEIFYHDHNEYNENENNNNDNANINNEIRYIERIRKLQKSRKNLTNNLRSHITEKKRNVFANTTYKNMPKNVVKEIANYLNEEDFENININSLKPSNLKRGETKKLKKNKK